MLTDKAKRKRKSKQKSFLRTFLMSLIVLPTALIALHPRVGDSLFADGIALSVMICAAVYILHEGILWLIASYLQIPDERPNYDYLMDDVE